MLEAIVVFGFISDLQDLKNKEYFIEEGEIEVVTRSSKTISMDPTIESQKQKMCGHDFYQVKSCYHII